VVVGGCFTGDCFTGLIVTFIRGFGFFFSLLVFLMGEKRTWEEKRKRRKTPWESEKKRRRARRSISEEFQRIDL